MPLSVIYEIALMTALISLSDLLFYSKKELRRLGLLIRHIINLVLSIVIVLSVAIFAGWIPWNNPILVGAFVGMVVVVYLMSEGVEFYRTKIKTDEMTKKIKKLNK